jgi:hypothetical protein
MLATVSLERFKHMSENTQDELVPFPLDSQDEDVQFSDPLTAESLLLIQASDPVLTQSDLPPEAQGEVNGGPLGCCLGVMVGLLLSLFLAIFSRLYATDLGKFFQNNYGALGVVVRVIMAILAVALAIFCGYLGWRLGKRFFREYELSDRAKEKERIHQEKLRQKA